MKTIRLCNQCLQPLPENAAEGLCPQCLARVALADSAVAGQSPELVSLPLSAGASSPCRVRYFGDYELQEEIARGGMGVVWKARQSSLNRTVALKMILAGKLAGDAEVQRFHREAEAAANLQHPNIVAIHEVGEHDGQHYYSMDYVAGRDLGALVREGGPLRAARAAECLKTIAEAVHFAHQRGTLHRDLKPQNVLMDAAGVPRITDFGLAKFIERDESLTQTGAAMGSPSYMPPEQAAGRLDQVGPHSDVYALGAILYELLTGRPPFRAETAVATMRQVMESEPVAPRKLNAAVPPDLETICLKCLEKNPARRYHSARALADDLGRFLNHEPIQAIPVTSVRKAESWVRRHPWTLMAAVSLVAMVLLGLLYWQYERVKFLEYRPSPTDLAFGKPGWRARELKVWEKYNVDMWVIIVYALSIFRPSLRRPWLIRAASSLRAVAISRPFARGKRDWKQVFNPPTELKADKPVNQTLRVVCGLIGVAGLGFSVLYLAKIIQAAVWEDTLNIPSSMMAYSGFVCNLMLLFRVVRDYQKFVHGGPIRALTPEQSQSLRQAIFDNDIQGAAKLYRQAIPEVSRDESFDFVAKLSVELKAREPEKFSPPVKIWALNWRAMGLCLAIELIVIVFACNSRFTIFYHAPTKELLGLASGFLLGAGIALSFRLRSYPKRFLVILSCILVGALATSEFYAGNIYFTGLPLGALMIVCGFTRKRRKSTKSIHTPADVSPAP
ncbi:MAG TPA: serine/threonine-protein kinase [Candidatus Baltobacteraceae bacterium]|jgi:serine/threonine protein kinase|nr:serine/threonine-protein kinase [Candidatus Baltobacteraceae bacterium]